MEVPMFVELHLIQNFAPSNLNRDDTGSPKDCEFGGYRRARISSQCLKRAVRTTFDRAALLPNQARAVRTKKLALEAARLLADRGKPPEEARRVVAAALGGLGIKVDHETGATEYLLFLSGAAIKRLADLCDEHWAALVTATGEATGTPEHEPTRRSRKDVKKDAKSAVPQQVKKQFEAVLDGGRAADLALFGRMVADLPDMNIEAACQVAHAISTHRVSMEFDYFTAVDDLAPREETGAGMLGTVEFNSACFYRYANVDLAQLERNLGGDCDLGEQALLAFVRGSVLAVPTGKQAGTAAQNPPSLVMAVVRDHGLWSLANAFLRPVRASEDQGLAGASIEALDRYWGSLVGAYGGDGLRQVSTLVVEPDATLEHLKASRVSSLEALVSGVAEAIRESAPVARR
jgi:CRISPR system Cascade subunit CasC